ncbi:MAG TPA: response regulator [Chloroflexi bacterium]|nr:response regulator [Chloroflexota bacterium]
MSQKILIADDQLYIRVLLEQTLEDLEDAGAELMVASDGLEAWAIVQAERPALVILDLMMPGLSGYQVCERIKSHPDLVNTYVIMLTAKGQGIDRQRSVKVKADEYITKPFDPDFLLGRAAAALGIQV